MRSHAQEAVSFRRWCERGWPEVYFNYAYATGWAALLMSLIAGSALRSDYAVVFALIASYRYIEVAVWYVRLLFDSTHRLMLSPERNLPFLTLDSAATVVVVGLWLGAVPGGASSELPEWSAALSTFTLNGAAAGFDGWQAAIATLLGTLGGSC